MTATPSQPDTSRTLHILHAAIQVIELAQEDTRSKCSLCHQRYTCRCLESDALVTISRVEFLPNGSPFLVDYKGFFAEPARLRTGGCYRMDALQPVDEEFCIVSDSRVVLLPSLHPSLPFVSVSELLASISACTDAAAVTDRFPESLHVAGEVVEVLLKEKEGRALVLLQDPRTAEMLQLWCGEQAFTLPLRQPLLVCDLSVCPSTKGGLFSVSVLFTASSTFCLQPPPFLHHDRPAPLHTQVVRENVQGQVVREQVQGQVVREQVQGQVVREQVQGQVVREQIQSHTERLFPHFHLPPFACSAYCWLFVDVEAVLLFRAFYICGTCGRVVLFADEHARQCAADAELLLVPEVTLTGQCGTTPVRVTLKGDCVWRFLGMKEEEKRRVIAFVQHHGLWKESTTFGKAQRSRVMEERWKEKREEALIPEAVERRAYIKYPSGQQPRFLWEETGFHVEESPCAAKQFNRNGWVCLLGKAVRMNRERTESRCTMINGDVFECSAEEGVVLKAVDFRVADPQWILELLLRESLPVCLHFVVSLHNILSHNKHTIACN